MNKDLCKPCTEPEILRFALFLLLVTAGIMVISLLISEVSGEQNQTQASEYVTEYNWSEPNILYSNPIADWRDETHPFPFIVTDGNNSTIYGQCLISSSDLYPPTQPWTDFIVRLNENGKVVFVKEQLSLNTTFPDVVWTDHPSAIFLNSTNSLVWIRDSSPQNNISLYVFNLNATLKFSRDLSSLKETVLDYCKDSQDNIHLVFAHSWKNDEGNKYCTVYYTKISFNGTILINKQQLAEKDDVISVSASIVHTNIIVNSQDDPIIYLNIRKSNMASWPDEMMMINITEKNNSILDTYLTYVPWKSAWGKKIIDSANHIHILSGDSDNNGEYEWIQYTQMNENGTLIENRILETLGSNAHGFSACIDENDRIHMVYLSAYPGIVGQKTHYMVLQNGTVIFNKVIWDSAFSSPKLAIDSTGNLHLVGNWGNKVLYMRTNAPADLSLGELPVDRPENLTYNLTLTIPVRITNPGTVGVQGIPVRFEVNGTEIENRTISLGPEENTTLNFNLTLGYNWTNYTTRIDTMGRLIESRVSNNEVKEDFYVPMPPPVEDDSPPDDDDEDGFLPAFTTPLLLLGAALSALVPGKKSRGRLS